MDKMVLSPPTDFIYDQRQEGWTLLADVPPDGNSTLELTKFLKKGETYVKGEIMLERAKERGQMAGQCHAERMLGMVSQIPASWQDFVLVFPGTVWQDALGLRFVPVLFWCGDAWDLRWFWLGRDWDRDSRLVRVSQPQIVL